MNIDKNEIVYFEINELLESSNHLKMFVNFLLQAKVKKPYRFSHVSSELGFLPNLTLKENILLDAIPTATRSGQDFDLSEYINLRQNSFLSKLYDQVKDLEIAAKDANQECKKIASLIKGILKEETDFLFLESPEKELAPENYHLLKETLRHLVENSSTTVFISSKETKAWASLITKQVQVSKNNKYILTEVLHGKKPVDSQSNSQTSQNTNDSTVLQFIPASNDDKEAA